MKRIIYLLIPVLIALTVLSCKRDYDDDYMGSVDERLNATLTAYQNELTSAEHGWMANISTSEGIYRFWMKFYVNNGEVMNDLKGNRVTMITDNMNYDYSGVNGGTAVPGTSSFRLKALQRPTLIFDTYSYLAVLCDPDDNVSHGSGNQGLQTDFEYEIASYEDSVFTLRGRTHRANATLVKATAEEERAASQAGMVKSIEALSRFIASQNYSYIETQKYGPVLFNFNLRSMSTSYEAADGKSLVHSDVTDSYVDFDQNIILPEPIKVADQVVVTRLNWNSRTSKYEVVLADGSTTPLLNANFSPIPLSVWIGPEYNREYNMTGILISWIDVIYSNYPLVGQYLTLYAEQLMDFGLELVQVNLYFRQKSDGSMYMELMPLFYFPDNSLYGASYNFDMAMPEPGVLRLGNYTCPFDANGFNTTFLEAGAGKELLDALAGQTFEMDWFGTLSSTSGEKIPIIYWQCKSNPSLVIVGYPEVDR